MWRHPDGRDEWAMRMLGAWLRDWRHATGATQRQLARVAGVDQAHICRIERGQRRPSGIPLARLVIALDWLSTGQGRGGPWSRLDAAIPSHAARWGEGRPPAVVGREPPTASAFPDPGHVLDVLLGPLPPADAIADSGPGLSTEPVVRPAA